MNATRIPILLLILQFLLFGCKTDNDPEIDKECKIDITTIDFSFGIDYNNPNKYLIPGEESDLSDINLEEIRAAVGTPEDEIEDVLQVCEWINRQFEFEDAGGAMAGKSTVDELYATKTFYGCHSLA
ncbi:MAG: hypothetical protein KAS29_16770, partial [Bacteroidales bacterium]|nr:hypothetical protein [Bacteroidales bacterium]